MSSNTYYKKRHQSFSPWSFLKGVSKVTGGTLLGITMLASSAVAGGLVGLAISFRNLPDVRVLRTYAPSETTHIYDVKGKLLASLHGEANREVLPLNDISPHLKRSVLAIEDSNFFQHQGVNIISVGRAMRANISEGQTVEGSSTLTMQLVKNLFLSPERSYSRKIAEAVLALRIEQVFGKEQIFGLYLNQVYWGHNNYGAETAARSYFNKSARNLNLAESAMMAGLIQAPESLSPFINKKLAIARQKDVLNRLLKLKWITSKEYKAALSYPIKYGKIKSFSRSQIPYVTEAVTAELTRKFGRDALLKGGMRIQTSIDTNMQKRAQALVKRESQRLPYRGVYADQMALVAVDPRTHYVKAIVGGVDYKKSQYNRATQARRQPGSSFKPFVYYAAFASGKFTPSSTIMDTRVGYQDGYEMYYPNNYDRTFGGAMSIRRSLELSRNIPAVRLGQSVGLNKVIEICRSIGIKSPIDPVISLPLGSVDLTPLEMAGAYAAFASNGWYSDTSMVMQVTDSGGNMIWDNRPKPRLVLDPWATAALTSSMQGVITRGTAKTAGIGRPAAGKTGTTSSERDVWFAGFVPQLYAAVWVGNDDYTTIGRRATGGGTVAPIWRRFMLDALRNEPAQGFRPMKAFTRP